MSFIAPHYLHISDRPRQGSNLLATYQANNYTHRLTTAGGYDTASCALNVRPSEAEDIFSNYVGCAVAFYVDDPTAPIWEGYIERITYRAGGLVLTRSLENMANRVSVTYKNTASGNTETTLVNDNADSQAIYGIKEMSIDGLINYGADVSHKNLLRDTNLAIRAWPMVSVATGGDSGGPLIELEMRGLQYMAWDWQAYSNAAAGVDNADLAFMRTTVRTDVSAPTNAPYIYLTGAGSFVGAFSALVQANATFNYSRQSSAGQTYNQYLQGLIEAGDGARPWIFGITPRDFNTGVRLVYYRAASAEIKYQVNALRETGRLRDMSGALIPGWRVTPDASAQIMDILIGYNQAGNDPRVFYIEAIEYDGESGLVSFQSGDNITMEGILQRNRYFRPQNRAQRFGAEPRKTL